MHAAGITEITNKLPVYAAHDQQAKPADRAAVAAAPASRPAQQGGDPPASPQARPAAALQHPHQQAPQALAAPESAAASEEAVPCTPVSDAKGEQPRGAGATTSAQATSRRHLGCGLARGRDAANMAPRHPTQHLRTASCRRRASGAGRSPQGAGRGTSEALLRPWHPGLEAGQRRVGRAAAAGEAGRSAGLRRLGCQGSQGCSVPEAAAPQRHGGCRPGPGCSRGGCAGTGAAGQAGGSSQGSCCCQAQPFCQAQGHSRQPAAPQQRAAGAPSCSPQHGARCRRRWQQLSCRWRAGSWQRQVPASAGALGGLA
jgi:hypothetical protein